MGAKARFKITANVKHLCMPEGTTLCGDASEKFRWGTEKSIHMHTLKNWCRRCLKIKQGWDEAVKDSIPETSVVRGATYGGQLINPDTKRNYVVNSRITSSSRPW